MTTGEFILCTITLTMPPGDDLSERLDHLHEGLKRITRRRRDYKGGRHQESQFGRMAGMLACTDFAADDNGWRPHVHALILVHRDDALDPFRPFDLDPMRAEWSSFTGDGSVVQVKLLGRRVINRPTLKGAVARVLTYASRLGHGTKNKPDALTPEQRLEVHLQTKRKPLIRPTGVLRGQPKDVAPI